MFLETIQKEVEKYFEEDRYEDAIAFLEDKITAYPDHNYLYWYLGLAWLFLEDDAKAADIWFSVILEQSEGETAEFIEILTTTANKKLEQRKFKQAQRLYEQILELDDSQPEIYLNYGDSIAQTGDIDGAIEVWQTALNLDGNYQSALRNLASAGQKLGEYNLAIDCYEQIVNIDSGDYQSFYNLALCYAYMNQQDRALHYFQACLQINPEFTPAYGDIGYILASQEDIKQAIIYWQKWVEIDSKFINDYIIWIDNLISDNLPCDNFKIAIAKFLSSLIGNAAIDDISNKFLKILGKIHHPKLSTANSISKVELEKNHNYLPNGYYLTTKEWAKSYITIYPETSINLNPPHSKDKYIHYSYRFGDKVTLPESFVTIIPEGRFWLSEEQASSAIITPDGKILGDLSPQTPFLSPGHPDSHPSKHSIFQLPHLSPPEYIDGKVAVLAGVLNNIYFHWMFDILPRFDLLTSKAVNLDLANIDYFLVSNHLPFQKESLEKLGIDNQKIIPVDNHLHIQARELIIPSFPSAIAWMPQWACDFLRNMFLDSSYSSLEQHKLIYITRQKSGVRRLINEQEIVNLLINRGFIVVNLETMSIAEQALLLSQAKVVVSSHGSGLTNLVFCRQGTKVIEIFSPNYVYPCYWLVSNLVGLEYHYLLGKNPEGCLLHQLFYPDVRIDDIWLNPRRLLKIIDNEQLIINNE